jgi:thiol-disulfide isomerase/thioredoxin
MEPPQSATRKWLAIGLAAVLAWVAFLATAGRGIRPGELGAPSLQTSGAPRPAEFGWTLLDLDDKPVDFSTFRGKPILLNIWATWCPPCREEMPSIANLAANQRLKDKGVVFLCVSVDESSQALQSFLKDKNWGMTILRATSLPPAFQTEGIPATFLIAPDGKIVTAEVGSAKWDDPTVIDFLDKLAKPAG